MSEADLAAKLALLEPISDEQRKEAACSLIGHSRIITQFFGYIYCARCSAQIGDSLGGYFDGSKSVIVGHDCDTCRENAKTLTWQDTFLTPDPFAPAAEAAE